MSSLYKTTDNGQSWFLLSGIHDSLGDMHFFNDSDGFIETIGLPTPYIPRTYRTTNGGATWDYSNAPFFAPEYYTLNDRNSYNEYLWNLNDAILIPQEGGWSNDTLWRTWDAGKTWNFWGTTETDGLSDSVYDSLYRTVFLPNRFIGVQSRSIWEVSFWDTTYGYAVGTQGGAFRTTDGGLHWTLMDLGYRHKRPDGSSGIVTRWGGVRDADNIYGVWIQDSLRVRLYGTAPEHTTDGGAHWYYDFGDCYPTQTWVMQMQDNCWGWANGGLNLLLHTTNEGRTWNSVQLPYLKTVPVYWGSPTVNIHSIDFFNRRYGWIGGDLGVMYKTTTGGKTWARCDLPLGFKIMAITFLLPAHGFAEDNSGGLWETNDSGSHWVRRIKSLYEPQSLTDSQLISLMNNLAPIFTISFPTPQVGYYADLYQVHKTTDGGATWDTLIDWNSTNITGAPVYVYFLDAFHGWLGTFDNYYYTSDGGDTWALVQDANCNGCGAIIPVNRNVVWGKMSTTDGGASWRQLPGNVASVLAAAGDSIVWGNSATVRSGLTPIVRWEKDTSCCACAYNEPYLVPDARTIDFDTVEIGGSKTLDVNIANTGGAALHITWGGFSGGNDSGEIALVTPLGHNYLNPGDSLPITLTFTPRFAGSVSTTLQISSNDTLEPVAEIAIRGVGATKVSVQESMLPTQTVAAYPNPFSTLTTIDLSGIPAGLLRAHANDGSVARATLRVYNMLGVQVADLTPLLNGQQTIEFDASALPPGVYVVKGNFGAKQFVQKLAVEK